MRYAGLDVKKVSAGVVSPSKGILRTLGEDADLLKDLGVTGEVVLLVENCELVPIRTLRDIRDVFQRVTRDVGRSKASDHRPGGPGGR